MKGAIVFDLDGTLIDSAPDIHAAAARMLADHGYGPLPLAQVTGFIGNGAPKLVERVMRAVGRDPATDHDRWLAAFLSHYAAAPAELTRLYPGVHEAVHALAADGHAIGLCTNKPEEPARAILRAYGLGDLFAAVVGGDTLAATKPDPRPLRHAFDALGAGPRLYVGDSEVDAATAQAAGVPFLLFTEGYRKAPVADLAHAAAFSSFADLPGLVGRHLARAA